MSLSALQRKQEQDRARIAEADRLLRARKFFSGTTAQPVVTDLHQFRNWCSLYTKNPVGFIKAVRDGRFLDEPVGLAKYLFQKYPIPEAFWKGMKGVEALVARLARGESVRTVMAPYLTGRQAGLLLQAKQLTLREASWWAAYTALVPKGCSLLEKDSAQSQALVVAMEFGQRLYCDGHDRPILEALRRHRAEWAGQGRLTGYGLLTEVKDWWEMAGLAERTEVMANLRTLNHIRMLHAEYVANARKRSLPLASWDGTFQPWRLDSVDGCWTVQELTNNHALRDEGDEQHHCVLNYTAGCLTGRISILTLRRNGGAGLTLEVARQGRILRQARGVCNRCMTEREGVILANWCHTHGVEWAPYIPDPNAAVEFVEEPTA